MYQSFDILVVHFPDFDGTTFKFGACNENINEYRNSNEKRAFLKGCRENLYLISVQFISKITNVILFGMSYRLDFARLFYTSFASF